MRIKEVIVVEGKNDTNRIKQAVQADTIETNGVGITKETIELIKHAQQKRGVIIFTDPDFAGNKIRQRITEIIPQCKHAYIAKEAAKPKKENDSVGIEHASIDAIRDALRNVQQMKDDWNNSITREDLFTYGLIGSPEAKELRELLGDALHIGYANGKQLLKRLQMFNISQDELKKAMMSILERGNKND